MIDLSTSKTPWLVLPAPNPRAQLRLFCFPYAGGSALTYRGWAQGLPEKIEVCAVQLPGRGNRLHEPSFTHHSPLIESLAHALFPFFDRPFAFFGHSMGAVLAYELSRRLRAEHRLEPLQLFVSGRRAPHIPKLDPPTYNLPEPEFVAELKRLGGTPQEVFTHPELMQLTLPLLRADFCLTETYRYLPGEPLNCSIAAFGGLRDKEVRRAYLEGWRSHTRAAFSLQMLNGDHFFINSEQTLLLHLLSQKLRRLAGPSLQ